VATVVVVGATVVVVVVVEMDYDLVIGSLKSVYGAKETEVIYSPCVSVSAYPVTPSELTGYSIA
jgi:hypothetical protein